MRTAPAVMWAVLTTLGAAFAVALLVIAGDPIFPAITVGSSWTPAMLGTVSIVWALCLAALAVLGIHRPHAVLDLWLMVVLCAWLLDVALSALLNGGRYDLGFYIGRGYGMLAGGFVVAVQLADTGR